MVNNAIAKTLKNDNSSTLFINSATQPLPSKPSIQLTGPSPVVALYVAISLLVGYSFIIGSLAKSVVQERQSKVKLQFHLVRCNFQCNTSDGNRIHCLLV